MYTAPASAIVASPVLLRAFTGSRYWFSARWFAAPTAMRPVSSSTDSAAPKRSFARLSEACSLACSSKPHRWGCGFQLELPVHGSSEPFSGMTTLFHACAGAGSFMRCLRYTYAAPAFGVTSGLTFQSKRQSSKLMWPQLLEDRSTSRICPVRPWNFCTSHECQRMLSEHSPVVFSRETPSTMSSTYVPPEMCSTRSFTKSAPTEQPPPTLNLIVVPSTTNGCDVSVPCGTSPCTVPSGNFPGSL
jgi:hypothetical protein